MLSYFRLGFSDLDSGNGIPLELGKGQGISLRVVLWETSAWLLVATGIFFPQPNAKGPLGQPENQNA